MEGFHRFDGTVDFWPISGHGVPNGFFNIFDAFDGHPKNVSAIKLTECRSLALEHDEDGLLDSTIRFCTLKIFTL